MKPRLLLAAGLALLLVPARAQQPPPADASDVVNALLAGLLGLGPVSEADLQRDVAAAGGLPFRRPVPLDFLTREQMVRYFDEVFDAEYPPARALADQRLLLALDLLPAGTDLRRLRQRLFVENVVGFYDERPGRQRLYAVSPDRSLSPANQLVLAHELRHALQDQYMDIHGLLPAAVSDFDDRRLALLSLLEGDATLVMHRYLAARVPGGEAAGLEFEAFSLPTPDLPGAPPVLRDQMVLPYLRGLAFARALESRGGWPAVREAFARPPESMEQVLHPEKYLEREPPRPVEPPAAPAGARLVAEGVLGELLLAALVGEGGEPAAAGWGGDAYRVYDLGGRTLVAVRSVWDSALELEEFQRALLARLAASHGAPRAERGYALFSRAGSHFAVGERNAGLDVFAGDDAGLVAAALRR